MCHDQIFLSSSPSTEVSFLPLLFVIYKPNISLRYSLRGSVGATRNYLQFARGILEDIWEGDSVIAFALTQAANQ